MSGVVRVMFIGHGPSNIAADRIVNVFHFRTDDDYLSGGATKCLAAVRKFYTGLTTGAEVLSQWLSPWVNRGAELRAYNMEVPKGERMPIVESMGLAATNVYGYAEEMCICLSLKGPPPVTPRRRGRLFFGPLSIDGVQKATFEQPSRPAGNVVISLVLHCKALADTPDIEWCIRSVTPSENYVPIESGYVDDAMDCQLRRGPDTTARSTWTKAL